MTWRQGSRLVEAGDDDGEGRPARYEAASIRLGATWRLCAERHRRSAYSLTA